MRSELQKDLRDKPGGLSKAIHTWHEFTSFRDSLPKALTAIILVAFLVTAAFLGCLLVELPWRDESIEYETTFFYWNVLICGFILLIIYLVGQRTRASIAVFLVLCLLAGTALHFVVEFKGQVILPADVAAVGTALSVSQGYTYELDERLWGCIGSVILYCVVLGIVCPRVSLGWRGRVVSGVSAVALVLLGVAVFTSVQFDESLEFEVDNWAPRVTYEQYGAPLSFLVLAQDAHTPAPAGYSDERANAILSRYADERTGWLSKEDKDAVRSDPSPTVIVIMNESFADLSILAPEDGACFIPAACREITSDSLVGGLALSSVFAGGTCNSEFEFLTGTSMAFQNGGYYPYMFQNFSQSETLPRYFQSIGYRTVALHPNLAANWKRDRVYPEMGFDEFLSDEAWGDVARVRDEVRDAAVYDTILDLVSESSGPQFLFAITMANHSGYWWEVELELQPDIPEKPEGQLGVYADLVQLADSDLSSFVNALQELDAPIVLCFFGDHQPSVSNWPLAELTGQNLDDAQRSGDIASIERYHEVPYFIWENDAQKANRMAQAEGTEESEESEGTAETEAPDALSDASRISSASSSICFLSAQLIEAAGLPQTPFMQLTNVARSHYPLFNAIGYFAHGDWLTYSVIDETPEILNEYAVASYGLLEGVVD